MTRMKFTLLPETVKKSTKYIKQEFSRHCPSSNKGWGSRELVSRWEKPYDGLSLLTRKKFQTRAKRGELSRAYRPLELSIWADCLIYKTEHQGGERILEAYGENSVFRVLMSTCMQGNYVKPVKNPLKKWKVAVPRSHTLPVPTSQTRKSHGS